ncbi:MAG TPA: MgtC/SapB family protein [Chloroflexota bacterium]|nr:MgtC/SapB family protein [Chloroflexota bacterium]
MPGSDWQFLFLRAIDLELMLRVLLAFVLGGLIGYERETTQRPAGLRTHMLVAAGSTAFTVAGVYGFVGEGTVRDPSRVAAQIVTGVGFLGAGTIWRTSSTVRGLTTAASIWLVAAVGMLVGGGMYALAAFTTLCGFATLRWGRPASRRRRILKAAGEPSITGEGVPIEELEEEESILD